MLLGLTHIDSERICAIFPCIGNTVEFDSAGTEILASRVHDLTVITTNENGRFSLRRINNNGNETLGIAIAFPTFPKALRAARKSVGWK